MITDYSGVPFIHGNSDVVGFRVDYVAPAAEMQQNGTDLGALNNQFLQKIEELTLYLIEQEKTNKKQQELLESQQDLIQQQAVELEKLSKKLNNIQ
ncbi:MAG: hypothetical protein MI922_17610, partial [Bacteroidales bacterium]|nr:hypothetical protein [Bacteroidales bacterium]